ncbi:right-handed parallel beta-helix repeat-containing protein [Niabella hibiscisoli]|uniref:right-handed parallel beta-helix repeat-containing protein n=1 Tax=Niabella hibiscisoli TaxID=1825928 RepID=UPI001F10B37C|nr:right-handed parallel beta-helix repeat-containing protein [Niabella hibiscisoli]MCH5716151.1 right-handed parallel beta-helix repeat-containing protein [Niabella hibiscisoli]
MGVLSKLNYCQGTALKAIPWRLTGRKPNKNRLNNFTMKGGNLLCLMPFVFFLNCIKESSQTTIFNTDSRVSRPVTYYIDPGGDDNNTGKSPDTPWRTLSKVNSVTFFPGDRILLKSGSVWNETLQPKGSGEPGAAIVIDKYGGDIKPVIHGGGRVNRSSTLLLDKVSYWELNNLEITNKVPHGINHAATGIRVNGGGRSEPFNTNITIKNCYIHDVNAATAKQPNYVKGAGGIIINGKLSDVLVQSCHIAHCSVEGLRTTGFGDRANRSKNIVFDNNLIENIYGDGIVMAQVSGGCRITNNTVYNACMTNDINFAGIWTVGSTNTIVARNEVYGMRGGGPNDGMAFDADGWDSLSATDGDIFEYNYSHDNNGGFFLFMNHARNITVRYNVSVNDVGTTGAKNYSLFKTVLILIATCIIILLYKKPGG